MKNSFFLFAILTLVPSLSTATQIGDSSFQVAELECPEGDQCATIEETFCTDEAIEISVNSNNTFDIVFNNFAVATTTTANFVSGSCILQLPINLESNEQVALKAVSVSGATLVAPGSQTSASITHYIGLRESSRTEKFNAQQFFTFTHAQELGSSFSVCGDDSLVISTRLDITARRAINDPNFSFISLASGAGGFGKIQYTLEYQDCEPSPTVCAENEFQLNGSCFEVADNCSDYTAIGSGEVCANMADNLQCSWDTSNNRCIEECSDNQVSFNGLCYDITDSCSGYDDTNSFICNNSTDDLSCDWIDSTQSCVDQCGTNGTFEIDGQCYQEDGQCSQYDGTNPGTCNNDFDTIGCDWIPGSNTDVILQNTCTPGCPDNMFVIDGICYEPNGSCSQFNGTSAETCNTNKDDVGCDWIPGSHSDTSLINTCVSTCPEGTFEEGGVCYDIYGSCTQYNDTDAATCDTSLDNLSCDWDADTGLCSNKDDCSADGFFELNGSCYEEVGSCDQYNDTNTETCNNNLDSIGCDWITESHSNSSLASTCVSSCPEGTFKENGICYDIYGACDQYNGTNIETCNNDFDSLGCDWIPSTHSDGGLANTCTSSCPDGTFKEGGVCYQLYGSCDQYNGTDSETCNNTTDKFGCDWISEHSNANLVNTCVSSCPAGTTKEDGICYEN